MNSTLSSILAILQLFFAKNPTVEEIITLIEAVGPALTSAKAGQAFSVSFPESISGKPGTTTLSWSPTPAA
jgi:hypothetical protein